MIERWKPVVGYEGLYEVSDLGHVRSLARKDTVGRDLKARVLVPDRQKSGHLRLALCNGSKQRFLVHRLVLEAFHGPCPPGMEGCHFPDRDPGNCRLNNLRWDTRKNNHADKVAQGTAQRGERNGFAKLNSTDIERMFDLRRNGCTMQQIGNWIGVHRATVGKILNGKHWAHLGLAQC